MFVIKRAAINLVALVIKSVHEDEALKRNYDVGVTDNDFNKGKRTERRHSSSRR